MSLLIDFYNSIFPELNLYLSKINKWLSKMFLLSSWAFCSVDFLIWPNITWVPGKNHQKKPKARKPKSHNRNRALGSQLIWAYICTYPCISVHIQTLESISVHTCVSIYVNIYPYVNICPYVCICQYQSICQYLCICLYLYICVYLFI